MSLASSDPAWLAGRNYDVRRTGLPLAPADEGESPALHDQGPPAPACLQPLALTHGQGNESFFCRDYSASPEFIIIMARRAEL